MRARNFRRKVIAGAVIALLAMPTTAATGNDWFDEVPGVSDDRLTEVRGGFEIRGLNIDIAIVRAVVINGELVTTQQLVIDGLAGLTAGTLPHVKISGGTVTIVQNGAGNVAPIPAAAMAAAKEAALQAASVAASAAAAAVAPQNAAATATANQAAGALGQAVASAASAGGGAALGMTVPASAGAPAIASAAPRPTGSRSSTSASPR